MQSKYEQVVHHTVHSQLLSQALSLIPFHNIAHLPSMSDSSMFDVQTITFTTINSTQITMPLESNPASQAVNTCTLKAGTVK
jgi:hypothetical protein